MYDIIPTQQFKRDVHKLKERGYDISLATEVISLLAAGIELPQKNKDHKLKGEYKNCRECHIAPDWLLIYQISNKSLILYLMRTGTHSDLF